MIDENELKTEIQERLAFDERYEAISEFIDTVEVERLDDGYFNILATLVEDEDESIVIPVSEDEGYDEAIQNMVDGIWRTVRGL